MTAEIIFCNGNKVLSGMELTSKQTSIICKVLGLQLKLDNGTITQFPEDYLEKLDKALDKIITL